MVSLTLNTRFVTFPTVKGNHPSLKEAIRQKKRNSVLIDITVSEYPHWYWRDKMENKDYPFDLSLSSIIGFTQLNQVTLANLPEDIDQKLWQPKTLQFETLIRGRYEFVQLKLKPFEPEKDALDGPNKSVWYISLKRDPNIRFRVFKKINSYKSQTTAKIIGPIDSVNAVYLQFQQLLIDIA